MVRKSYCILKDKKQTKQIKTNKTCFLQTNNKSKQNISIERKGKFLITKETISLLQNQFKGGSQSFGCVDETSQLEMCPNDGQQVLRLAPFIRGRKAKLFAGELQDKGKGQEKGQTQGEERQSPTSAQCVAQSFTASTVNRGTR